MAKRGKGEEEKEEYDFIPPDFDEDAFIHKEMISFRTTSTLIIVGILAAVVSWLAFGPAGGEDAGWWLGLGILVVSFLALKPLYKALKFDISHYGRREWLGTGFLLFFTWLAFFMILLNPPFSDHADPHVDIYASPGAIAEGDAVRIDLFVSDNDRVSSSTFGIYSGEPTAFDLDTAIATKDDLDEIASGHYRYEATLPAGTYTVHATAEDRSGLSGEGTLTLQVVESVIQVFPTDVPDLTDPTREILVTIADGVDVWSVYADFDGDPLTIEDRVYFEYKEERGGYEATSAHRGWTAGSNNFTIFVEEEHRFQGQTLVPGAILESGPYEIEVANPGDYNPKASKGVQSIAPPSRQVPGLEVPIIAAGLLAVAFVLRRR